ncbi:NAD(P)H-dependent oxidoreductase [Microvirga massiliensis]|uniref:NAD(P)H-dependent oxidoreductase n=1 Tax=Microvirga massiliensis TaxID=1033741 RepID=UPI00062BA4AB|nr:SAF domain-containing protein [Microvirga massiliensis]
MIIVDTALARRAVEGNPIRVGMVGAGFMAKGVALQAATASPGIRIAAIANRTLSKARTAYEEAGQRDVAECSDLQALNDAVRDGRPAITSDPVLVAKADGIDVLLDVTGAVEDALPPVLAAIAARKHVILMNPELDGTVGPILRVKADDAGVIFTNVEGDQPGVIMNLFRFVRGLGIRPVLCGNIKGLHDPYRNPTTQAEFARRWGQNPSMVTSFADGTKISFEQAIVANATGMRVGRRGMYGPTVAPGTPIQEVADCYPVKDLLEGPGIVDYVVGAAPGPGVFVIGTIEHPQQRHYLNLYKLGEGPLYTFYMPYHLCHFEVPTTIARAVLFDDAAIAPVAPRVDVITAAKRDLKAGEILDGLGQYMIYGLAENADETARANLLPIGVAVGCRLKRDVARDNVLTYDDVELPAGRLCDQLRTEQAEYFKLPVRRTMAS